MGRGGNEWGKGGTSGERRERVGRGGNEWGEGGMSGERGNEWGEGGQGASIGVVNRQEILDVACTASRWS